MNTIAATKQVSFSYGRTPALHNINIDIHTGSFFGLVGRNGAGKTTLLKVLTGLLLPQTGSAEALGRDARRLEPRDWAQIGYVSESQPMYDWLTGLELIAFLKPLYTTWDDAFCEQLGKLLRLPLERKVRGYSKGERMKMALLLAMSFHPQLLVLDEPFSGLDVLAKEQLIKCLLEVTGQERWSVVLASHDLAEVERLADSIGVLDGGHLVISEPIESLQNRFRRVQVFEPNGATLNESSVLNAERSATGLTFVETAFSPERETTLRQSLGAKIEITPLSLREIVLALLSADTRSP